MSNELLQAAAEARKKAYAPYSGYKVGAAVQSVDGAIFVGCNVENVSYGLTNCAERTAIFTAIAAGCSELATLAVVADSPQPVAPCGACRQVMAEFGIQKVIMGNLTGAIQEAAMEELLPLAFRANLKRE
jgi:cytidine deaminase